MAKYINFLQSLVSSEKAHTQHPTKYSDWTVSVIEYMQEPCSMSVVNRLASKGYVCKSGETVRLTSKGWEFIKTTVAAKETDTYSDIIAMFMRL